MNPRLEIYRRGGGLIVRTIYLPGGRRAYVLDPYRRARAAATALLRRGVGAGAIARSLRRSKGFVWGVKRGLGENNWKISNKSVAGIGKSAYMHDMGGREARPD